MIIAPAGFLTRDHSRIDPAQPEITVLAVHDQSSRQDRRKGKLKSQVMIPLPTAMTAGSCQEHASEHHVSALALCDQHRKSSAKRLPRSAAAIARRATHLLLADMTVW
ncbi:MAG: hypothetical protein MZV49_26040 [Rhodopseudomonas palustris]|nr:hypothetical protein [Rhodopseudomonas palustris]